MSKPPTERSSPTRETEILEVRHPTSPQTQRLNFTLLDDRERHGLDVGGGARIVPTAVRRREPLVLPRPPVGTSVMRPSAGLGR